MAEERLQKILAHAGIASRRAAEQLILRGEVKVNGQVVTELGARADAERDRIEVSGRAVGREEPVYFVLHKPRGIVTTLHDPEGRPSLSELLTGIEQRIYPVGRLDFHTSGALLLTNDGDLAQALLHPSKDVPKTYVAKLNVEASDRMIAALRSGVTLDDGYRTREASVIPLRVEEGKSWLEITITEGKNRQIHRMLEAVNARVMRLSRISFAGISTEGLRPGQLRPLDTQEIAGLRRRFLGRTVEASEAGERRPQRRVEAPAREPARRAPPRASGPRENVRSQERKTRTGFDRGRPASHKKGPT